MLMPMHLLLISKDGQMPQRIGKSENCLSIKIKDRLSATALAKERFFSFRRLFRRENNTWLFQYKNVSKYSTN